MRGGNQHGLLPQRTPGPALWRSLALALQKRHGTIHCTNAGRISPTNPPFNCQSNRGLLPRKEPLAPCHGQILSSVSKGIMAAFPEGKLVAFIQRKHLSIVKAIVVPFLKEVLAPCHGQILPSLFRSIMATFPERTLVAFPQRIHVSIVKAIMVSFLTKNPWPHAMDKSCPHFSKAS